MTTSPDTIFALATAPGRAGIAIVRLSGPNSGEILSVLGGTIPPPRASRLCRLHDRDGLLLDEALVLAFAEGASFTGDAVVELHMHGSMAVVRAVLSAIEETGLARLALPGEFTRRAFLAGRLDLSQVQGLGDLIDAETEAQRRQALRFLSGEMAAKVEAWRGWLIRAIALLEATIDFVDEDVPIDVIPEVTDLLSMTQASIQFELDGAEAATRIRSGFDVALVGAPNVGKSSLLNRLTRSDAALVSEIAGTTRDVIEVRMDIGGVVVNLLDTAGIRQTDDTVEGLGIARAMKRAEDADLRLYLHDGNGSLDWPLPPRSDDIILRTKVDLDGLPGVSSLTGVGIDDLLHQIGEVFRSRVATAGLVAHDRDRRIMADVSLRLKGAANAVDSVSVELLSETLRAIARDLRVIIGGIETDAVLDEIFSSFCLGK